MDPKIALRNARILEATVRANSDVQRLWILAELIEDNWQPVDPDLIKARELAAKLMSSLRNELNEPYLSGWYDNSQPVKSILAGIKYGRGDIS